MYIGFSKKEGNFPVNVISWKCNFIFLNQQIESYNCLFSILLYE